MTTEKNTKVAKEDSEKLVTSDLIKTVVHTVCDVVRENNSIKVASNVDNNRRGTTLLQPRKQNTFDVPWWYFGDPVKYHIKSLLKQEEETLQRIKKQVVEVTSQYKDSLTKVEKLKQALSNLK